MFKIFLIILLLLVHSLFFVESIKKEQFIIFGEENFSNKEIFNIIEKKVISNQTYKDTSFNIELSDIYYETNNAINLNSTLQHHNNTPIVIINSHVFSCDLEKINSENVCLSLSNCDGLDYCGKMEEISDLFILGKQPIYSLVATDNGIHSKSVKLQAGEYEIIPNNDDPVSSNYCKEIELDGVSFQEFTMGIRLSQDNASILCINIGDGCYGMLKDGEIKICDINKVIIKT